MDQAKDAYIGLDMTVTIGFHDKKFLLLPGSSYDGNNGTGSSEKDGRSGLDAAALDLARREPFSSSLWQPNGPTLSILIWNNSPIHCWPWLYHQRRHHKGGVPVVDGIVIVEEGCLADPSPRLPCSLSQSLSLFKLQKNPPFGLGRPSPFIVEGGETMAGTFVYLPQERKGRRMASFLRLPSCSMVAHPGDSSGGGDGAAGRRRRCSRAAATTAARAAVMGASGGNRGAAVVRTSSSGGKGRGGGNRGRRRCSICSLPFFCGKPDKNLAQQMPPTRQRANAISSSGCCVTMDSRRGARRGQGHLSYGRGRGHSTVRAGSFDSPASRRKMPFMEPTLVTPEKLSDLDRGYTRIALSHLDTAPGDSRPTNYRWHLPADESVMAFVSSYAWPSDDDDGPIPLTRAQRLALEGAILSDRDSMEGLFSYAYPAFPWHGIRMNELPSAKQLGTYFQLTGAHNISHPLQAASWMIAGGGPQFLAIGLAVAERYNPRWNTICTAEGETAIDLWAFHRISGLPIVGEHYEEVVLDDFHRDSTDGQGHYVLEFCYRYLLRA
ncbi:hypothetical protein Taro_029438 [Colocasia esculenta]|uniref:Uncharacterized protein n=1 Tax=Colocasia esculenta TaxID=4460 RepID=A0A843VDS9_COLES|nr:hypothetical protein [Colocasia esculenta]